MIGYCSFLLNGNYLAFPLQTANDSVYRIQKILLFHYGFIFPCSYQSSFVTDICNICARKTRCLFCQERDVEILFQFDRPQMHLKNSFPLVKIG